MGGLGRGDWFLIGCTLGALMMWALLWLLGAF